MPLGEEREVVARGEIGERLRHAGDHFHGALQDAPGESHDGLEIARADLALGQVFVALAQVAAETQRAIAMNLVVGAFDLVQHVAHFARGKFRMGQELDELVEGALEVDVIFPERVVGIKDQVPARHFAARGARWKGISNTASTSTGRPLRSAGSKTHCANASAALRSSRTTRWCSSATLCTGPPFRFAPTLCGCFGSSMFGAGPAGTSERWSTLPSNLPEKLVRFGI